MAHRNRGFTYEKWWFSRILQASPGPPGLLNHGCAARKGRSRHAVIVQSWQLVTTWTNRRNMETPFFCNFQIFQMENEKKRENQLCQMEHLVGKLMTCVRHSQNMPCGAAEVLSFADVTRCTSTWPCYTEEHGINLWYQICGAGQCQFPSSSTTYPSGRPSAKNANGRSRNRKKCNTFFTPHALRSCRKCKPGTPGKSGP